MRNFFNSNWDVVDHAIAYGKRIKLRETPEFVGRGFFPRCWYWNGRLMLDNAKSFQATLRNEGSSRTRIDLYRSAHAINLIINGETFWIAVEAYLLKVHDPEAFVFQKAVQGRRRSCGFLFRKLRDCSHRRCNEWHWPAKR